MTEERNIDSFLDAAAADTERSVVRTPSFASVLARAHSLAPGAVPAPADRPSLVAVPSGHDDDDMSEETVEDDTHAADLAPFLAAARAVAHYDVAARLQRPLPPLPRRRPLALTLTLAAAAAVLLFALGAPLLPRIADVINRDLTRALADASVNGGPQEHSVQQRTPASPARQDIIPTTAPSGEAQQDAAEPAVAEPPTPPTVAEPVPSDIEPSPEPPALDAAPAVKTDAVADQLARLDDEAEALLLAGELDDADARYRQMIALGGRRAAVEHAYADRWLIARRRGDDDGHRELLSAYLKKFPRGRFADEASAGLCRLAATDARPACWRDYSERFPGGAYRREAEEAAAP